MKEKGGGRGMELASQAAALLEAAGLAPSRGRQKAGGKGSLLFMRRTKGPARCPFGKACGVEKHQQTKPNEGPRGKQTWNLNT